MLLTITNTSPPATDLGYLLHKNPARLHEASLGFGTAYLFYPEASPERCTAAILLSIDSVELVRGRPGSVPQARAIEDYVNDRPYVASSFVSVALARMFGSALGGRSKEREELVHKPLRLEAGIPAVPARGGKAVIERLFSPLGYDVEAKPIAADEQFPEWGDSGRWQIRLSGQVTVHDLLSHFYVLLPVLDDDKHYYIGKAEVDKLLRHGEGWLSSHPSRDLIVERYLQRRASLTNEALARLTEDEEDEEKGDATSEPEKQLERPLTLHTQRLHTVAETLRSLGSRKVLDLGCGEGKLLRLLIRDLSIEELVGMDVSWRSLEGARRRLQLERLPERVRNRVKLIQGSLVYRDRRLEGYDAAAVVEVIEHLDPARLVSFERVLFEFARPKAVIVTTPNREYNRLFPTLPEGRMRHGDHRFEWSRSEFTAWASRVAERHGYDVRLEPIGPVDEVAGAPSQMAVFTRKEAA